MALVYKAVQQGVDRRVAIKVLRDEFKAQKHAKRMEREGRSISEMSHPNLVSIYDMGTLETGQPYQVLEFLDGHSLADVIDADGALSPSRAIPIFIQVCDVVQYAHDNGLIDRDISPMNVMLIKAAGMDDYVKLVDFGVLKFDESRHAVTQRLTLTGEVCGNPMYMSPEQACGQEVDYRTDIYSFGVVMWEAVTGKPLFAGNNIADILTSHLYTKPAKPSSINRDVPAALEEIILCTLEKNPGDRFQSMQELKAALSQVLRKSRNQDSSNLPAYYGKIARTTVPRSTAAATRNSSGAEREISVQPCTNTVRDLGIAFVVALCAGACICFLFVQFVK